MVFEIISMLLVIICCGVGLAFILAIMLETTSFTFKEDVIASFIVSFFIGLIAFFFGIPSFISITSNINDQYLEPTQIIKTNNSVHVIYIDKENMITKSYVDIKSWNSTNIKVRVRSGKNIWKRDIQNETDILVE